jgi:tetratricopeptide (TPR) repeat protein
LRRVKESSEPISTAGKTISLLIFLLVLLFTAGQSGAASFLTSFSAITNQIDPVNTAVLLDANNPDAHYIRATILSATDLPAAVDEFYKAALARPDDYVLWLNLARARELNGETEAAVAAARQAIPLAPAYAEPHYQLGNILLRAGQNEEAFRELRLAGDSDPTLMPGIIDLAWRISKRDINYVVTSLGPPTPQLYAALAHYFRQQQEPQAATSMYLAAGRADDVERRSYVPELIFAKRFKEAAQLWAVDFPSGAKSGAIDDPGFEQESKLGDRGFGWSSAENNKGFRLMLDASQPREGRSSLKIEFDGESDPSVPVIYQLVMIEPNAHYQLKFSMRAENLVSGGMPAVFVTDADTHQVLGQSEQFPKLTEGWREYIVEIETLQTATALQIAVRRQPCAVLPCPIFGRLWLDNLSLNKS